MVSGIVAIFVGVAALFVSAYTSYLEHKHAQAEVWPLLVVGSSDEGGGFRVTVSNKGTGPATIRDWKRRVDGRPVTTWTPWIETIVGRHIPIGEYYKSDITGATLTPNESVTLFGTGDSAVGRAIFASPHESESSFCYCSVFEDCWVLESRARRPVPVAACPDPGPESWVGIGDVERREIATLYGPKDAEAPDAPGPAR